MTVTATVLLQDRYISNTEAALFTASSVTIIDAVTVTNISGAVLNFSLSIIPSGVSADNKTVLIKSKDIRVGESYLCPELTGHVMSAASFLSGIASASDSLNIRVSGRVIT